MALFVGVWLVFLVTLHCSYIFTKMSLKRNRSHIWNGDFSFRVTYIAENRELTQMSRQLLNISLRTQLLSVLDLNLHTMTQMTRNVVFFHLPPKETQLAPSPSFLLHNDNQESHLGITQSLHLSWLATVSGHCSAASGFHLVSWSLASQAQLFLLSGVPFLPPGRSPRGEALQEPGWGNGNVPVLPSPGLCWAVAPP